MVTTISQDVGSYSTKRGDTLGGIANRFGTTVSNLQSLNSDITDVNKIGTGQQIKLR